MPFVRDIVRRSAADNYKVSTLITNIVLSDDFTKALGAGSEGRSRHQASRAHQVGEPACSSRRSNLSRCTMLRGAGAAIALPLLDSMIPAGTALAHTDLRSPRRAWASSTSRTARS